MKVVGTGAPRMLTIRLKACEVNVFRDELHHRRSVITEAAAAAHAHTAAMAAGARDPEVEDCHDELALIAGLLDQLRVPASEHHARELVGPTWLLAPVVRGAAGEATHRLVTAVEEFCQDRGRVTADQLRAAVDSASACAATLIALDYAQNHAVV